MEKLTALTQVLYWLIATIAALTAMELALYWVLLRWRASALLYWAPVVLLSAVLGGLGVRLGAEPSLSGLLIATPLALAGLGRYVIRGRFAFATMMIAPAFVVVALLVIYPFFFEFRLAFANLNLYTINKWLHGGGLGWVGFDNFIAVLTTSPLQTATFWQLLGRTLIWTGVNLVCHVGFGLGLALLMNRPLRGKGIYRTLLILPWAMPQVVAILAWRGEFHPQFGFVNQLLSLFGVAGINWWSDPVPVFMSCCIVNIWLGIPFMMIVFLGGLQGIPKSLYEAASIDGASKWRQFTQVTLPMLKPVVVPSITLGTIWTFNNVNVIYLLTGQDGGNEYADILVSALYKSAFTYSRYSFSAAFAMIIFAILIGFTLFWMRVSRGTEAANA